MPAIAVQAWPNTAQINVWYKTYCDTHSKENEAIFQRAVLLKDIYAVLGDDLEEFLRDSEKGFDLTAVEAHKGVELVESIKRYPGGNHKSAALWDALGGQITRLQKITNPIVRKKVRNRIYRYSEEMNGFVSPSKLTNFIKIADPNYFEDHPSQRKIAKEQLIKDSFLVEKERNALAFSMRRAIKLLEEEGYDADSFFTKKSLKLLD